MANRNYAPTVAASRGTVRISGSFAPNGSSAVSSASVKGNGFTVARTDVGVFTVTLTDRFAELLSFTPVLQLATADDKVALAGATDVVTNGTLVINVWDISGAALADVSADANNRINFEIVVRNSTLST